MAEFQIISDLHLEAPAGYDVFEIAPKAPYLALLGDIGNFKDDGFLLFLEKQLWNFRLVFFVSGNHEPYYSSWQQTEETLGKFTEEMNKKAQAEPRLGTFVVLDRTRYDVSSSVTVLGCTLFSQVTEPQFDHVSFGLNDFYRIRDWDIEQHCAEHKTELAWLNEQVALIARSDPLRKIVIFTHYSPSLEEAATDPKHMRSPHSSGFCTDLSKEECFTNPQVRLWAFGHTHFNCDFKDPVTGKRLLTNQRGYYFAQSEGFEPEKVVTVG
ncbi:MAG: hypothetical protein M1819_007152 [Sarea resinae]|nr:MAG: hypothetical protein M1819_007152 [Sarea resinae]